jgi:hypothetical protein
VKKSVDFGDFSDEKSIIIIKINKLRSEAPPSEAAKKEKLQQQPP